MSQPPAPSAGLAVGRVSISGVNATAARSVGAAIEQELAVAASEGRITAGHRPRLTITLPHGADAREVAAALVRALERR